MQFSLSDRHKVRFYLNMALLRSAQYRAQYQGYNADLYRMDAKLSPTEYQVNQVQPILFTKEDLWARLDKIEQEAEFLVSKVQEAIATLDTIEAALSEARSDPNYALVQAEKIIWEQSERTSGMLIEREEAIARLRYLLDLPPVVLPEGGVLHRG